MDPQVIIQIVGTILGGSVLAALLNAVFGRKKMSADVAARLNEAAGGLVERVEDDNERLRKENKALEEEVHKATATARTADERAYRAERRSERLAEVLRDYVAYAARQTVALRAVGGVIEDPPDVPVELMA